MGRVVLLDLVLFLVIAACVSAVVWVLVGLRTKKELKSKNKKK